MSEEKIKLTNQQKIELLEKKKEELNKKRNTINDKITKIKTKEKKERTHRLVLNAATMETFIGMELTTEYVESLKEFLLKERQNKDGTLFTYKSVLIKMTNSKLNNK